MGWKLILRNGGEGMVGKLLSGGRDGMFPFDVEVLEDLLVMVLIYLILVSFKDVCAKNYITCTIM